MDMYKKNLEIAIKAISRVYTPVNLDKNNFAMQMVALAEIDYLKDTENSLYKNGELNSDVFNEWLSTKSLASYDK